MSTRLYEEFLKPLLLVALFAPPEELSAGAVLGAFYFYSESSSTSMSILNQGWRGEGDFLTSAMPVAAQGTVSLSCAGRTVFA